MAAFTVPSAWEAAYYSASFGLPSARTSVCHLGSYDVQEHLARIDRRPLGNRQAPYVFTGGQTDRDYDTFLTALAGLDVPARLNAPARSLGKVGAPANVLVQALMPREAYFAAVANATVVAIPLRPVYHAAGLSLLLAAMSVGRPIVCSDTPVTRDYVTDSQTALLVPPGDAAALRAAIARLMTDESLRAELGANARRRWQEQHTLASFAAQVDQVLTGVVEGR